MSIQPLYDQEYYSHLDNDTIATIRALEERRAQYITNVRNLDNITQVERDTLIARINRDTIQCIDQHIREHVASHDDIELATEGTIRALMNRVDAE